MPDPRVILVILDGFGVRAEIPGNAIELARMPVWQSIRHRYPSTLLDASGLAVGLRAGLMGNSEVGHLNLGAGRVVWQDITRIDRAIDEGSFFANPELARAFVRARESNGRVHLLGLTSDGGVHADVKHYLALIEMARRERVAVEFHAFMDGRDTPPRSGPEHLKVVADAVAGAGRVATVSGRYYAMDRDRRWERTALAWRAIVLGEGATAADPIEAVLDAHAAGTGDEFIPPCVIGEPRGMRDGDSVIFFNFRTDRPRQLTLALTDQDFREFERPRVPAIHYVSMTRYHEAWTHLPVAFPKTPMERLLGEVVADARLRQFRISETEKYAHVTFFFNGGSDTPYPGEERILVPSPKVATYDRMPEMNAHWVTDNVLRVIESDAYAFVVVNFPNPDMVGHTGVFDATVRAVETVDACLGRIFAETRRRGWTALLTADHGNAEQMIDVDGQPHTYHTTNPVPFVVVDEARVGARLRVGGSFGDVAPTVLDVLGIAPPAEMEGASLLA